MAAQPNTIGALVLSLTMQGNRTKFYAKETGRFVWAVAVRQKRE